jgi:hypothetical protein
MVEKLKLKPYLYIEYRCYATLQHLASVSSTTSREQVGMYRGMNMRRLTPYSGNQ